MTTKDERKRLLAEIERLVDSEAQDSAELCRLARQWSAAKQELKRLQQQKRAIAARFKQCDANGIDALKKTMSEVSGRIARAEAQRSEAESALLERIQPAQEDDAAPVPAHLGSTAPQGEPPAELKFAELDAASRPDWDAFAASQPRATLYHDSRWADVIGGTMRQQNLSLLAYGPGREVAGILPLYRLRSRLFGDFAVSVPYLNYGGALGRNGVVEEALMREAARRAADFGLEHVEFRDRATRPGWVSRDEKVSMLRRLPESAAALDAELGSKLRAQIGRARRERAVVEAGNGARALRAFYKVFARNMRDLGTPVYARALFERILALWPDDAVVLTVRIGRKPLGGAFLIRYRDTVEVPWASTVREANPLGVNMLMYWEALSWSIARGARYFDFGRSTRGSGTYRFKRQWGAVPVQHHWHTWLPDARSGLPALNPDNARYRTLIKIWQHLPVPVTRWIGPGIVRNLP